MVGSLQSGLKDDVNLNGSKMLCKQVVIATYTIELIMINKSGAINCKIGSDHGKIRRSSATQLYWFFNASTDDKVEKKAVGAVQKKHVTITTQGREKKVLRNAISSHESYKSVPKLMTRPIMSSLCGKPTLNQNTAKTTSRLEILC